MKFGVIFNISPCGEKRLFVLRFHNGQPCIVGNAKEKKGNDPCIRVYGSNFEETVTHPLSEEDKVLYEVHLGDYIAVSEKDQSTDTLLINLYEVMRFDDGIAYCDHRLMH